MRQVFSSHIESIGHDPATNELHVKWDTGKTSVYSSVPPEKADAVANSWSVGKALRDQVKGQYDHRYV